MTPDIRKLQVTSSWICWAIGSAGLPGSMNSVSAEAPSVHQRLPYNPLWVHPADLTALGLADGDPVEITSDTGSIRAVAKTDASVRIGVVQMSHCFGGLPDEALPFEAAGACTNLLVSTDRDCEEINAMPRQSGIPVRLRPASV